MPSIDKMTRPELIRDLKVAREAAAKARKAAAASKAEAKQTERKSKTEIPAELELLRSEVRSLKRRERLEGGVQALIVSTAKMALADWDGKVLLPPPIKFRHPKEEVVAVAHLTDIQLGKKTETYCTEIAEGRMLEYARKAGVEKFVGVGTI
ncbi:MAG: hypothetical protein AAB295_05065, partial [Chloroflexota bacterium]